MVYTSLETLFKDVNLSHQMYLRMYNLEKKNIALQNWDSYIFILFQSMQNI